MQAMTIINDNDTVEYQYASRFVHVLKQINEAYFDYLSNMGLTLTIEQLEVLRFVYANPSASLNNIIETADLTDSVIADAVTELEQNNLIQSQFDDETHTQVYYMSVSGITIMRDLQNNQHRTTVDFLSELALDKQVVIIQMLERALLAYSDSTP